MCFNMNFSYPIYESLYLDLEKSWLDAIIGISLRCWRFDPYETALELILRPNTNNRFGYY